jgi:glycosyl transferase family 25
MKYFDKIYIINLKRHTKRRKIVAEELKSVGWWNYEFIDAVAGSDLPSTTQMVKEGTIHNVFRDANGILTKNIFACSMSHRKAQQKFLEDGLNTCLIVEDDVKFLPVALKMMAAGGMDQIHRELHSKDWDIFMWGMPHTWMPTWDVSEGCRLLHDFKRLAPEWAAHAYQITRRGAEKLIECNTPIQYAADVNVEASNTNIYCPVFSFMSQTIGNLNRNIANEMMTDFGTKILHNGSEEYLPSTINTDAVQKNTDEYYSTKDRSVKFHNRIRMIEIAGDIDIEKVEWHDHVTPNGDTALNWPHIYLKG